MWIVCSHQCLLILSACLCKCGSTHCLFAVMINILNFIYVDLLMKRQQASVPLASAKPGAPDTIGASKWKVTEVNRGFNQWHTAPQGDTLNSQAAYWGIADRTKRTAHFGTVSVLAASAHQAPMHRLWQAKPSSLASCFLYHHRAASPAQLIH